MAGGAREQLEAVLRELFEQVAEPGVIERAAKPEEACSGAEGAMDETDDDDELDEDEVLNLEVEPEEKEEDEEEELRAQGSLDKWIVANRKEEEDDEEETR